MVSILFVDDDPEIARFVQDGLSADGYRVITAATGREALERASEIRFAAVILDRMLPDFDGLSLLKAFRSAKIDCPVLFLSALGATDDRVAGLKAGGDDYVAKPFSMPELSARLEALLRRSARDDRAEAAPPAGSELRCGELVIDLETRSVRRGVREIPLRARELEVLLFLIARQGQVVTRGMLLEGVWRYHSQHMTNVIEVYVSRLREKVDVAGEASMIRTVRGVGYVLSAASVERL